MLRILPAIAGQWTIVDDHETVLFAGTLRQCEDWLDFQENSQAGACFNDELVATTSVNI